MRHVIGDDIDHSMACGVDTGDSTAVQSDVGIGHVLTHLYPLGIPSSLQGVEREGEALVLARDWASPINI